MNQDKANGYTHRNIVFAGGLAELWDWECEGISETVNDVNRGLTDFWRCLKRRENFDEFHRIVSMTPFSQDAWNEASLTDSMSGECEIKVWEAAAAFFIRFRQSRQGLGKDYATPTKRIRRGMNENVSAWLSAVEGLPAAHERLKRVEIRNLDFAEFIRKLDHPKAFFYCDPPYLHETRGGNGSNSDYEYEMTPDDHEVLLKFMASIEGQFMLSGYRSELYDEYARMASWRRVDVEIDNKASSKKTKDKKTECLWMNY